MRENRAAGSAIVQLDADEILALRENLEASIALYDGPPGRRVPESLCAELDQLLHLVEMDLRVIGQELARPLRPAAID